jgi:hypothetical protein
MSDKDLLYEVAKLSQFDACDAIWWRWDAQKSSEGTRLMVLVNCNDLFYWGCADCEEVTEDNLPVLREAVADCERVSGSEYGNQDDAFLLFCCRVRGMRPQGAYYKHLKVYVRGDDDEAARRTTDLRALFDACGPEREVDYLNNPKAQDSA